MTDNQTIKISMDIKGGTFSIETSPSHFKEAMEQVEALLDKFRPLVGADKDVQKQPSVSAPAEENEQVIAKVGPEAKKKKRGGGPQKTVKLEQVDMGLTSSQRDELRTFFASKAPKTQNDKVAVLAFKLKEFTKKGEFDVNEIHTALKIVNQPTPGNLTAVFGNMKTAGIAGYSDRKVVVNHLLEDHVNFHMNVGSDE